MKPPLKSLSERRVCYHETTIIGMGESVTELEACLQEQIDVISKHINSLKGLIRTLDDENCCEEAEELCYEVSVLSAVLLGLKNNQNKKAALH